MAELAQLDPPKAATTPGLAFYSTRALTGRQKAAVIVQLLLSEGGDLPLTALPDHMQAALTEQIGTMRTIDRDTLSAVVEEFCTLLERVGLSFPGGIDGALKILDGRISTTAASRLKRLAGASSKLDPWDKIAELDVDRLLPILGEESIEVCAVMLSKLAVPKAAELLGRLPGERARPIAYSVSQTGNIDPETVRRIGVALAAQLETQPIRAFEGDPVDRVGAILNVSPAATRDEVLKGLAETDAGLAEQVRKTIFTFVHVADRIVARDVPKIIKAVDQAVMLTALGGATGEQTASAEFILANMSQRMAAALREEIGALGKLKEKDIEAAQTAVIIAIRELEAAGELQLIMPEDAEP
ncbi:MAG: FliG C-terminal domain-containing protein [Albidovulum sp.]